MAFIRSKTVGGRKYYQLVRNYRESGKHRQEVLYHLGANDSIKAAIAEASREEAHFRSEESKHLRDLEGMKEDILAMFNNKFGDELPNISEARERERFLRREYDYIGQRQQQRFSWSMLEIFSDLGEELRFLREVHLYHSKVKAAEWCKEQAEARQAKLETLRRCQQAYG